VAVPEEAADGFGFAVHRLERKRRNQADIAVGHGVEQAQRRGQAALGDADARAMVAGKP
jgi:hypothetical protein